MSSNIVIFVYKGLVLGTISADKGLFVRFAPKGHISKPLYKGKSLFNSKIIY